jgi:hypothetical protein
MSQVLIKDFHSTTLSAEKFVLPVINFVPASNVGNFGGMVLVLNSPVPANDGVYVRVAAGWSKLAFSP